MIAEMNAEQKLKWAILVRAKASNASLVIPEITAETVDGIYDDLDENDQGAIQDARNEIRCSGEETKIPCDWSRHYESHSVAARMPDGSWVGWTYWYGGGKHGEPEAVDWMDSAYDLDVKEEEKKIIVRTFTKK